MRAPFLASCITLLVGCAAQNPPAEPPAKENTQEPQRASPHVVPEDKTPSLPPAADVSQKQPTPPELYERMKQAAKAGNFKEAVYLFALAGSDTYYDTLRVPDATLHDSHGVLIRQSFRALDGKTRKQLKDEIRKTLGSKDRLPAICRDVARAGPPDYAPDYMAKPGSGEVQVTANDAQADWTKALNSFLHCGD